MFDSIVSLAKAQSCCESGTSYCDAENRRSSHLKTQKKQTSKQTKKQRALATGNRRGCTHWIPEEMSDTLTTTRSRMLK